MKEIICMLFLCEEEKLIEWKMCEPYSWTSNQISDIILLDMYQVHPYNGKSNLPFEHIEGNSFSIDIF